ncbi:MAG TPA: DUF5658 family protein [Bryobacteraceae bacterium]|nr:DUF5658 family protein [Bryobacteraceae bacterium]
MDGRLLSNSITRNPQPVSAAAWAAPGYSLLVQFSYLPLLDLLTTIAFLTTGIREANPVVRLAMAAAPSPLVGLLALKACAFLGAVYCARSGRGRVLSRVNMLFAALVVWNLLALLSR